MKYNNIKILMQFLEKGLTSPAKWGTFELEENNHIETEYDQALKELGFRQYLVGQLQIDVEEDDYMYIPFHPIYLELLHSYTQGKGLTRTEDKIYQEFNEMDEEMMEIIRDMLNTSEIFIETKRQLDLRTVVTKREQERILNLQRVLAKKINVSGGHTDDKEIKYILNREFVPFNREEQAPLATISTKNIINIPNVDVRSLAYYKQTNITNIKNVPPEIVRTASYFIPQLTNKPNTLFTEVVEGENGMVFKLLFELLIEYNYLSDVKTVREVYEDVISLGTAITNRVCVAYAIPETSHNPEYFKVLFRYGKELEFKVDRNSLPKVMALKGLTYNDELKTPIVTETKLTVWDTIHQGAYKPKNRDETDLRLNNIGK